MEFLMKFFLGILFLFNVAPLIGESLKNSDFLKVEASFIPKVILMDYAYESHLKADTIELVILYEDPYFNDAQELQDLINQKFNKKLTNYTLNVKLFSYKQYNTNDIFASMLYMFPTDNDCANKVIKKAKQNHIMTFTSSSSLMKLGAIFSLDIGKKVQPVINLEALKDSAIELRPILLKISQIYKSDT